MVVLERAGQAITVESGGKEEAYRRIEEVRYVKPQIIDGKELEGYKFKGCRKKPSKYHPWR